MLLCWQSAVYDPGLILRTPETLSSVPSRSPRTSESDDHEPCLQRRHLTYTQPDTIRQSAFCSVLLAELITLRRGRNNRWKINVERNRNSSKSWMQIKAKLQRAPTPSVAWSLMYNPSFLMWKTLKYKNSAEFAKIVHIVERARINSATMSGTRADPLRNSQGLTHQVITFHIWTPAIFYESCTRDKAINWYCLRFLLCTQYFNSTSGGWSLFQWLTCGVHPFGTAGITLLPWKLDADRYHTIMWCVLTCDNVDLSPYSRFSQLRLQVRSTWNVVWASRREKAPWMYSHTRVHRTLIRSISSIMIAIVTMEALCCDERFVASLFFTGRKRKTLQHQFLAFWKYF